MTFPLTSDAWRGLRREWLWVYRGRVPVCGVWSARIRVPAGVFFVESGEGRIRAEGSETRVSRGQAFFSAPGLREHWFAPGTRLLSAAFLCEWADGLPLWKQGLNFACESPALRAATLALFRRAHPGRRSVTWREAATPAAHSVAGWSAREAAFSTWLAAWTRTLEERGIHAGRRTAPSERRVQELLAHLDALPLATRAPTLPPGFPLGPKRADQLLREHLGLGQRAYLEKRRMEAARARVLARAETLKEIAFELGFRHASHFTAWFRRHTGMSPTAFREGLTMAEPV